jgi:hypothetical protein
MIHDLPTFEQYFTQFKGKFGIKAVVVGGYNELIQLQSSQLAYPVLVLETPEFDEDADGYFGFQTRIAVLEKWATTRKTSEYKTLLNECREAVKQVCESMRTDRTKLVYRPFKTHYEFIERGQMVNADALFGAIAPEVEFISFKSCE